MLLVSEAHTALPLTLGGHPNGSFPFWLLWLEFYLYVRHHWGCRGGRHCSMKEGDEELVKWALRVLEAQSLSQVKLNFVFNYSIKRTTQMLPAHCDFFLDSIRTDILPRCGRRAVLFFLWRGSPLNTSMVKAKPEGLKWNTMLYKFEWKRN